nr:hypothetical protein [Mycoplasmopsis cynos]
MRFQKLTQQPRLLHPDAPSVKLSPELETRLQNFRKVFKDHGQ